MYKLTDSEFKSALRQAVIEHEQADNPEEKFPPDYKPLNPLWRSGDGTINRTETLAISYYSFLTPEQKAKLLEEV